MRRRDLFLVRLKQGDEQSTLKAIQKLGGTVRRDERLTGKPIVSVDLGATEATDATLALVTTFKSLRVLVLCETKVTDAGLKAIKDCKRLERLDLWRTNVTDSGMNELKELKQLRSLTLNMTRITDAGLKGLKSLKRLETLQLKDTAVTDAGLEELKSITSLRAVSLFATKVTGAGVAALAKALPNSRFTIDVARSGRTEFRVEGIGSGGNQTERAGPIGPALFLPRYGKPSWLGFILSRLLSEQHGGKTGTVGRRQTEQSSGEGFRCQRRGHRFGDCTALCITQ